MSVFRRIKHADPEISVVIPTLPDNSYGPPESLQNQSLDAYEVVVISDADLNRCEARNKGIEVANADIVAQTDDDCIPPETWLEDIYENFTEHSDLVIVEGILDKLQVSPRNYPGANLAYQRDKALNIGGFDAELNGWRADTDFGWRLEDEYGLNRCRQDPELEVKHQGLLRTDVNREIERKFRARHPERYFTVLDHPHSVINKRTGKLISYIYWLFPKPTERLIRMFEGRVRTTPS
jgi:GT2 family glycosyltransferase